MYAPPIARIFERSLLMLKRNAIVKRRIENAHGLMLSINAATKTSGRSQLPSPLKFQRSVVPILPILNRTTKPIRTTANAMSIVSFLVIPLGRYDGGKPELKWCAGVIFHAHDPLDLADTRRSVSSRIKDH